MQIQDIERIYDTKKEVIIKRKKEILDISIKCGVIKHNVHIFVDSEKFCVDNKEIKICDLKTMYIWGLYYKGMYSCSLEIQQKGFLKGISLTITGLSNEDIEKVNELFEHFIFSNEKDLDKLTSNLYTPIVEYTSEVNDINTKEYAITDNIINIGKDLVLLNNEYCLYEILPKEYFNKYAKRKDFLIYRSKFINENYIELWVKKEDYAKEVHKKNLPVYIKLVALILLFIGATVTFFNSLFDDFFYNIEIIKYCNNSNISLYFLATMFPNIILMIIFTIIGMIKAKKKNILKITLIGFILATLFVGIFDIFNMPTNYEEIKVKGNAVSMLNYKYAILKDMIQGKTTIIVTQNVSCYSNYIKYFSEEKQYVYCSKENSQLVQIANELLKYEKQLQIEYYNNTGIIKSIDGIEKSNYKVLSEKVKILINKQTEEEMAKIQEQEKENKEKRELNKIKNDIMTNAIGQPIEKIEQQLKENSFSDYSIKYISSKLYNTGIVAFVEKKKSPYTYYVVKDNNKEDFVKMPKLAFGMTKDEIIEKLQENGLNYEYDTCNWGDHESGTLHTCGYAAGTLLPKGTIVWFSIDE